MGRLLGNHANELKILDHISGSEIVFTYRMPTTAERESYANDSVKRVRNKIKYSIVQSREKYGAKILTGIREGDFEIVEGGRSIPIASDPGSEHYREDWKALVTEHAADLVQTLARHVFDAPTEVLESGAGDAENAGRADAD